jgi:hypothetical protein
MNILKNILIALISIGCATFFVYASFVFGMPNNQKTGIISDQQIKKSVANIITDSK